MPPERDTSLLSSVADFAWGFSAVILTLRVVSRPDESSLYIIFFVVVMWVFTKMMSDGLRGAADVIQKLSAKRSRKSHGKEQDGQD